MPYEVQWMEHFISFLRRRSNTPKLSKVGELSDPPANHSLMPSSEWAHLGQKPTWQNQRYWNSRVNNVATTCSFVWTPVPDGCCLFSLMRMNTRETHMQKDSWCRWRLAQFLVRVLCWHYGRYWDVLGHGPSFQGSYNLVRTIPTTSWNNQRTERLSLLAKTKVRAGFRSLCLF